MGCKTLVSLFVLIMAEAVVAQIPQQQKVDVVRFWAEQQFDEVAPGGKNAIAVHFELEKGWHFYASPKTAPGGMNLKVEPNEQGSPHVLTFSKPIFPKASCLYDEALGKKIAVIGDKFTVYLPFTVASDARKGTDETKTIIIDIGIEGAVCTRTQCRVPDLGRIRTEIRIAKDAAATEPRFALPAVQPRATVSQWADYTMWAALGLAFLAGLSLNIMPCVWPVLPIVVMRLVEQAKRGKSASFAMGLAFCAGVLLFFGCLAGANIILKVFYGTVLQWGDQFREPIFVGGMAMLLVVLALFMFDVFTISIPSSIAGKGGSGRGYAGAVGMGFLAAILSTPCSFAILAAAFAWAQAQPLGLATLAIMVIGIGMAVPYLVLTAVPGLLGRIPRPGRWMELFKQTIGFVLLVIAVKLIAALPEARRMDVLYFAVVLSFCVWMWGGWVSYGTRPVRKWIVRIIAAGLAVAGGFAFLGASGEELINWQKYDATAIEAARKEGRPVLIKFTADWCLSCQVVEKTVYRRSDVARMVKDKNVLAIKADTTVKDYPATIALKEIYNEPGVPVSILFVPGENEPTRWRGMGFGDELKTELSKI
jgi:thiol:disulfide interchange protein